MIGFKRLSILGNKGCSHIQELFKKYKFSNEERVRWLKEFEKTFTDDVPAANEIIEIKNHFEERSGNVKNLDE